MILMKRLLFSLLILFSSLSYAVYVNSEGRGEALIIPYYSVNNSLNTVVSLVNTRDTAKAVKINIREGLNGHAVLSYNVYLDGNDTWTFVMGGINSTVAGVEGQPSGAMASSDNSCAPLTNKGMSEFSPAPPVYGPIQVQRVREGFIEIIEMGELQGDAADAADSVNGVPDCQFFESAWQTGGIWHEDSGGDINHDLAPASGGLMAEADMLDVSSGVNYSIPTVALVGFFADGEMAHVSPTDSDLSLDAAAPKASILTEEGVHQLELERGIDAVSAILMTNKMFASYSIDAGVQGVSEIIFTQPTRRFYIYSQPLRADSPYPQQPRIEQCDTLQYEGVEVDIIVRDREAKREVYLGTIPGDPPPPPAALCGSVFVISMKRTDSDREEPLITQSNNFGILEQVRGGTENGYISLEFMDTRPLSGLDIHTGENKSIMGLPVIGLSLTRFKNYYAQPGILAQYGMSHPLKAQLTVVN